MMSKILITLLCTQFFLVPIKIIAANNQNIGTNKYVPYNMLKDSKMFTSPEHIKNKFEINIDKMAVKKVENRKSRYSAVMDDVYDAEMLTQPIIKQLKTMDVLYSHPSFISVVKFPPSFKITMAKTNIDVVELTYSENLLTFSLKKNAKMGNIVLTAFDKEVDQNKVFNFIVKKYSNSSSKLDNEYGLYSTNDGEFLSLTTFYTQIQKVDEIKLLQKYVEINGLDYFKESFSKDGNYESLLLDGVPIFIIRDDINGYISYYDINLRISIGGK